MTDEFFTVSQDDADRLAMYGPLPEDLEDAERFLTQIAQTNGGHVSAESGFTLTVQTAQDLCDEPDTDGGQILGPLVLAGGRTIIVGDTGEGKTTLVFQLVRTILAGETFLDWTAQGGGRALIIDLEQGRRSVKRALRDARLDDRTDVDLVLVPDGLSLDRDAAHLAALDNVIRNAPYTIVALDPYYKAHRADEPNAERPIVDLMRTLDALRARHGFALILPAHPRKEPPGAGQVRRLTIHDIAGSGAVTRGAELVLGIERVAHGHARLRFLKDREGDLPIDEAWNLIYDKTTGFARDPKDHAPERDLRHELLEASTDGDWRTIRDYMKTLKAGDNTLRPILETLQQEGILEYTQGPEGRHYNSKCWRLVSASATQMQMNADDSNTHFATGNSPSASCVSLRKETHDNADAVPATALASANANADDRSWADADIEL